MWMSKLQLTKVLRDYSEVVSVHIEQPWQLYIMLGALDATVCTNFRFTL